MAETHQEEQERISGPATMPARDKPKILVELQERKKRHKQRGVPARVGVVVLGLLLVIAGVLLSGPGIPGPGFLVVLLGLSFLALEFDRAERLLEKTIVWADRWKGRMEATPRRQKMAATAVGLLLVAGFVIWALLGDIPLLPVV